MNVTERFLRYVSFDTKSDEMSETCPSTDKQKVLGAALVEEMLSMGIADARMDEYGYVYGTVPGDPKLPTIGLIAHMDTSPDASGADVKAKILLIGVGNDKNTFIHSIEERLALPDRISNKPYDITIKDYEGREVTHPFYQQYCSKTEDISWFFGIFEKPMVEMGVQTFGKFGDAQVRIVDAMGCRKLLTTIYTRAEEDIFAQHIELPENLYK